LSAYVVVNVTVNDAKRYEDYKALAPGSIEQYGGKYLARGGHVEALEGSWKPNRMVILEFPSVEKAKSWWSSTEYAKAKAIRQSCSRAELVVVQGL
jgi:uncharacterized protein (DUF1330 family)